MTDLPRLLGDSLRLLAYPLVMVLAEKIVTVAQRVQANTRWRDFADIYLLSRLHDQRGEELIGAVRRVADHRRVSLRPLAAELAGFGELNQSRWRQWLRRQRMGDRLPGDFANVVSEVTRFAGPAVDGSARGRIWWHLSQAWRSVSTVGDGETG